MTSNNYWEAVATLVSTIVGVGIFALPFVALRAGFFVALAYLLVFAGVFVLLHLMFGEIMLRTKERHRFPGYVGTYFGQAAKRFAVTMELFMMAGGMLVYLLIGSGFMRDVSGGVLGPPQIYHLLFWAVMSLLLLSGLRSVKESEFVMLAGMISIIFFIFLASIPHIHPLNFFQFGPRDFFLPYGVTLFALAGTAAIPAVRDILEGEEVRMRRAVTLGTLIPILLYVLFVIAVLGVSGPATSENALSGLRGLLGNMVLNAGAVLGVFLVATSYLVFGLYAKDLLRYDMGMSERSALLWTLFIPFALLFVEWGSFIEIIGFLGALFGGVDAIFIVLTYRRARARGDRAPEYSLMLPAWVPFPLVALFSVGIVYFALSAGSV